MSHHDAKAHRRKHLLRLLPFAAIAAVFLASDLVAMRRVAALRGETDQIVHNMLQSIALVSSMQRDLDEVKLLADRHVLEKQPSTMAALEAQIAEREADYAAAARRYEPLTTLAEERATWDELRRQVMDLRLPLAGAIALSRENRDAEAEQALAALDGRFDAAHRDMVSLVAINRRGAEQAAARVLALQRSSSALLEALALGGIILTLTVGLGVSRRAQRREDALGLTSALLEARNRELDAFAGRVAHDLRGPLSTATLAADRLARQMPEQDRGVDPLRRAFMRMEDIIEDLLALSRVPDRAEGACDPAAAADQLREELAPRADSAGVHLTMHVQPGYVRCTEGLFRQVIWNLADNAMKYRRADVEPHVDIEGHVTDAEYELSVRDNGLGMTPEDASHVFEPFYRGQRGGGAPGTGLGLSIVRRVVEASGGTVSVSSEVGRGTVFRTRLPLADGGQPRESGP